MTVTARFKEVDVTRAVKGAKKGGLAIARVEIDANGAIVLYAADRNTPSSKPNSLDRLLA